MPPFKPTGRRKHFAITAAAVLLNVHHASAFIRSSSLRSANVVRQATTTSSSSAFLPPTAVVLRAISSSSSATVSHRRQSAIAMGPPPLGAGEKVVIIGGGIGERVLYILPFGWSSRHVSGDELKYAAQLHTRDMCARGAWTSCGTPAWHPHLGISFSHRVQQSMLLDILCWCKEATQKCVLRRTCCGGKHVYDGRHYELAYVHHDARHDLLLKQIRMNRTSSHNEGHMDLQVF